MCSTHQRDKIVVSSGPSIVKYTNEVVVTVVAQQLS